MIGLFDSGVGGITVLKVLEQLLPNESFVYFSDSAHFPYGKKTPAELISYTTQITSFLLTHNIKLLVIPCHTASALALPTLQNLFSIPMIGMVEPTVKALKRENKRIAILATEATIQSGIYQNAIQREIKDAVLFPLTSPELIQRVEMGEPIPQELVRSCLKPILGKQVDTLLLASTHFPHLKKEIAEELDPQTIVLDPALSVAEEVIRQLERSANQTPEHLFYTSGNLELFQKFLKSNPPRAKFEVRAFKQSDAVLKN